MTYYEELGISADAAEEDIRQAHRRLVKLLHPDQQSTEELRRMAGLQMMRVNSVVEQLLDPTQRKLYDLAIRAPLPTQAPSAQREVVPKEAIDKWWKYAASGVAVAIVTWIFTAVSPTDVVRSVTAGVLPGTTASASDTLPPRPKPQPAPVPKVALTRSPQPVPAPPTAVADRPVAASDLKPAETAASPPAAAHYPAPTNAEPVAAQPKAADPVSAPASQSLSGVWLYAGGKRTAEDERLYKPEYIELRIQDESGVLHGEYRSRYAVTDLPISPAVNFSFHGGLASTMPWKGPKGSSGTVVLKLLNRNAMQVDWKVADPGDSGIGLEFGTAVLIRRL